MTKKSIALVAFTLTLGFSASAQRLLSLSDCVQIAEENTLEIKVTTLLWNYCNSKTMEENPMAKLWANNNRIKDNKPLPMGLIGPVIIS